MIMLCKIPFQVCIITLNDLGRIESVLRDRDQSQPARTHENTQRIGEFLCRGFKRRPAPRVFRLPLRVALCAFRFVQHMYGGEVLYTVIFDWLEVWVISFVKVEVVQARR